MRLHQWDRRREPLEVNLHLERVRDALPLPVAAVVDVTDHGHSVEAVLGVLHLPDPPQPVKRAVVEVEDGVARRGARVAAGVDAVDVVACSVDLVWSAGLETAPPMAD